VPGLAHDLRVQAISESQEKAVRDRLVELETRRQLHQHDPEPATS
jgi:hypothetical protein